MTNWGWEAQEERSGLGGLVRVSGDGDAGADPGLLGRLDRAGDRRGGRDAPPIVALVGAGALAGASGWDFGQPDRTARSTMVRRRIAACFMAKASLEEDFCGCAFREEDGDSCNGGLTPARRPQAVAMAGALWPVLRGEAAQDAGER
mgnify:CR=1 FL=1